MRILNGSLVLAFAALAIPLAESQPPDCDQRVNNQISVYGINSNWTAEHVYSTATVPAMGFATSDMSAAIDSTVANFMNYYGIPGGAVAMTYNGKVIFAKSYGYIDDANQDFALPDSRYRIDSITKSITAMGIMKLVHNGKLSLTAHPFPFSRVGQIIAGSPGTYYYAGTSDASNPAYNSELSKITVDDLLHHAGGWDRTLKSGPGDLMGYQTLQPLMTFLSTERGSPSGPPNCTQMMAFVESQPLQDTPSRQTHYSNVGFCALSETIAETSGQSYFNYISANVLTPLGMVDTAVGGTTEASRLDRETKYYDFNDPSQASLFPPYKVEPAPYSSVGSMAALEGAGELVDTAVDIAKFGGAVATSTLPMLGGPPPFFVCLGPGLPSDCEWPQDYYSLSTALPSYECVDPSQVPPYASSDSCTSKGISTTSTSEANHQPYGAGWDAVVPNVVPVPLVPYNNFNFIKVGGDQGGITVVDTTGDGYSFAALFNQNDNTVPAPDSLVFWPGCASSTPAVASSTNNCALQAAYNHAATTPWNVDFTNQYVGAYSGWMNSASFKTYLLLQQGFGLYPSRIDGRNTSSGFEYRGRFVKESGSPSNYLYGKSCSVALSAIQSAPANTPLVSLQRFKDTTGSYVYQAVWSPPIP